MKKFTVLVLTLFIFGCIRTPENLRGNFICGSQTSVSVTSSELRVNNGTFPIDKIDGNIIRVNGDTLSFDPVLGKLYWKVRTIQIEDCKKTN
ncbi:hypothetical protein M2131_001549 [Polynucleobacter sphagniphilus]|uniref:hypothetical protein n=1 Tax=Polynucleobacter sphagniphilus TaxID=1743169 RepID=UPI002473D4BF|nr:hypothetical protein [Polynucleobacter sphagniphilus]MDH6421608.1 hypothetical protein [Polynucleobacter sphagniphilus]